MISIKSDEVHIWQLFIQKPLFSFEESRMLSGEERAIARKFYFQKDRARYIASHSTLRILLGNYLQVDPSDLKFAYNQYGKPVLKDAKLSFNMSHSDEHAVYAFVRKHEIGIDIEKIRPDFATQEVAEKFFSNYEASVFWSLPASGKTEAFYNCWTRKEAFIKAVGEGLSYPLKDFDVTLAPGEPAKLLKVRGCVEGASGWTLQEIPVTAGYKAAVAIKAKYLEIKIYGPEYVDSILSNYSPIKSD